MMKPLLRWLSSDKLTILAFHGVPAVPDPLWPDDVGLAQLEQTLVALKGAFTFVPLSEGLQLVRAGRLPKGAAAVTFDDGYPGWCEGAAPLLERLNVHATFFVTTGQLGGAALWTERLRYALTRADVGVDLRSVHAEVGAIDGRLASRQLVFNRLTKRLKYTDQADREQLLCRIERACGVPTAGEAGALASQFTPDDVRSLHARGFGVGAHSVNHTVLSHCTPDEAWQECERSKATLEQGALPLRTAVRSASTDRNGRVRPVTIRCGATLVHRVAMSEGSNAKSKCASLSTAISVSSSRSMRVDTERSLSASKKASGRSACRSIQRTACAWLRLKCSHRNCPCGAAPDGMLASHCAACTVSTSRGAVFAASR
mgnify:CR=1 FL=1